MALVDDRRTRGLLASGARPIAAANAHLALAGPVAGLLRSQLLREPAAVHAAKSDTACGSLEGPFFGMKPLEVQVKS